jgi:sugar O-acyltransferase (sialic acid O-acetyltransferase NeuD family)
MQKEISLNEIALIGFDLDIIDLIETCPTYTLYGYIDIKNKSNTMTFRDLNYLGTDNDWETIQRNNPSLKIAIGMDNPEIRKKMYILYRSRMKENLTTIKSPKSHVSKRAVVGNGCIIQHNAVAMPCARIGNGCSLHVNSAIHHESELGDYSILAPGATVLGRVIIGKQVYVGAGAIVKQNCKIGDNSQIGAGAVVVNDIPPDSIVVGVPANRFLPKSQKA